MGRGSSSSGGGGGSSFSGGSFRGSSRSSYSRGSSRSSFGHSSHHHHHHYYGGDYSTNHHNSSTSFLLVGIISIFIGLAFLAATISNFSIYNSYAAVEGTAIDNTYVNGWNYTTYTYTVDGTEYENRSQEGWEFPEIDGAKVIIYYLKEDPNVITENAPPSLTSCIVVAIIPVVLFTTSTLLFIKFAKLKKKEKLEEKNSQTLTNTNLYDKEEDVICKYCESKFAKSLNKCPHCGASRK